MKFRFCSLLVATLTLGCAGGSEFGREIDSKVFGRSGGTLFEKPEEVSLREVHLSLDKLSHSTVIIQGTVSDVSPHGTYLVLGDESGRLLVMLTSLVLDKGYSQELKHRHLRVLGSIESGKKGLPLLRARAIWGESTPVGAVKIDKSI